MSDAGQRDDRNGGSSETKRAPIPHGFMALASGTRFARGYTIQSVIAAGGFGITYPELFTTANPPVPDSFGHRTSTALTGVLFETLCDALGVDDCGSSGVIAASVTSHAR